MTSIGMISTFYSYKGGTGRSMAMANVAWLLAARGLKVLTIDWDLEAPGLHRYFRPFLGDKDLVETEGLIDTFWDLASAMVDRETNASALNERAVESFNDASRRLVWKFPTGGYVDFICAGRQGATYSTRVNTFDWKRFYELGGAAVLDAVRQDLRQRYDWVLIDSRTGVSDTSGICTIQLPDMVVPCFTLNRQSIDGVTGVLRSIRGYRGSTTGSRDIVFFPLATRIENAEQKKLEIARDYARAALTEFLPPGWVGREYWDKMEVAYRPSYAFEEVLAAFGDATDAKGAADTMIAQMEGVAQRITGDADLRAPEVIESDRQEVLKQYALGGRLAAKRDEEPAPANDTATDAEYLRSVTAKEQVWRRSNFSWRALLSRRELDLLTPDDRARFGRNLSYYVSQSDKVPRLLGLGDLAFVTCWLISIAAGLGYNWYAYLQDLNLYQEIVRTDSSYQYYHSIPTFLGLGHTPIAFAVFSACLAVAMIAFGAYLSRWNGRPYGVGFGSAQTIVLLGPFRPQIEDYAPEPDAKTRAAR